MAKRKSRELKRFVDQELHKFFVAGGNEILKGDFVGIKPGYGTVRPWNPGDVFAGVAYNDSSQCGDPCKSDAVMVYTLGDFVLSNLLEVILFLASRSNVFVPRSFLIR